ncbi:MAG TPA: pyrroline-5-carboxylate reductase [Bacteroidales bacterium]|nr:pyrroline-5-carboxylate reductase [Bacteroidales bacterium]
MKNTISFIGAGRITKIFLQAFQNKHISLANVSVFDTNNQVTENLKTLFPEITVTDLKTVSEQGLVFIALHPPVMMETLGKIQPFVRPESTFVSLAPKINIEKISTTLGTKKVARLIPNATSFINQGYNPISFAEGFEQKDELISILGTLGKTFETAENKLEAYAIASAMLPTYFWFQWFEMVEIGKQMGLTEAESKETVAHSLLGAIHTAFSSNLQPAEVTDLIPVKPISEHEQEIKNILQTKLMGLFEKIKP